MQSVNILDDYTGIFTAIGTVFTILAFIFALLASSRAKEIRHIIVNTFLNEYFTLKQEEKNLFFYFAKLTNGGKKKINRYDFLQNMEDTDLKDSEYWLKSLVKKNWIKVKGSKLFVANDKIIIANNISGE